MGDSCFGSDHQTLKDLKAKMIDNNLKTTNTDKRNIVVILPENIYSNKTHNFIQSENLTIFQKNLKKKFQEIRSKTINKCYKAVSKRQKII